MYKLLLMGLFLCCCSLRAEVDVIAAGEVKLIENQDGEKIVHIDLFTWWKGEGYAEQYFYCDDCGVEIGKIYLVYLNREANLDLILAEAVPILEGYKRFDELGIPFRRQEIDGGLFTAGYLLGQHDGYHAHWISWLGLVLYDYNDGNPFIFHPEHGWFAQAPEPEQWADFDAWFWDFSKEDWLYTGAGIYPFMFSAAEWDWLYYFEGGTPEQRWFYSFKDEAFESVVSE